MPMNFTVDDQVWRLEWVVAYEVSTHDVIRDDYDLHAGILAYDDLLLSVEFVGGTRRGIYASQSDRLLYVFWFLVAMEDYDRITELNKMLTWEIERRWRKLKKDQS